MQLRRNPSNRNAAERLSCLLLFLSVSWHRLHRFLLYTRTVNTCYSIQILPRNFGKNFSDQAEQQPYCPRNLQTEYMLRVSFT